jgi:hypothetical protein
MPLRFQAFVSRWNSRSARQSLRPLPAQALRFESLEARQLLAAVALNDFSVSNGTGEKPQSKVWEYADQWWTVMPSSVGTSVWRLDGTSWTPSLLLSSSKSVTADVKSVDGVAHVLLFDGAATQLASIEYDGAGNYSPWTMRPTLVPIALSGAETATIDVDSTGRIWLAADNGSRVDVRYSDGLYQSWSSPITVASGIASDDITVITALPNGTVGVLWSNQSSKRFGFSYRIDGAAPTEWSTIETPAAGAALNIGGGMADDHLNVAVASDGTLYAAVKTSYDSGSATALGLLVRRPNGVWDDVLYRVDTGGTRPIVLLNETAGKLIVAYAASEGTANIVYRETSLDDIAFGPRQTLISGSLQNVSSTKQNFSDEVALIASNGSVVKSVLFSFGSIVINQPPSVDAGPDRTIVAGAAVALDARVTDDGDPAALATTWSLASGPGAVAFDDPTKPNARATFTTPGAYVLRIVATDGQYFAADQVTIVVAAPAPDPDPHQVVVAAFQDGVAGYNGTRDTMIRALNANTNHGSLATLEMDGSPDIASLVAWDVSAIPRGSIVVSASFELHVTNTTSHSYDAYVMDRAWDEMSATWNLARTGQSWATAGASGALDHGSAVAGVIAARTLGTLRVDLNDVGRSAVQRWIDDPLTNHGLIFQNYATATDGLDFRSSESATVSQRPRLIVTYTAPPATDPPADPQNAAPTVSAGPDQSIVSGQSALLAGSASDDGAPGSLVVQWTKQSGPGVVTFADPAAATSLASFSAPGVYVLRLTANDGSLSAYDDVTVTVTAAAPTNLPPTVNAGIDRTAVVGSPLTLSGSVTDDGLPGPVATAWTKLSGPGTVAFGNAGVPTTTASFSQPGTYVLRLTASDGQYSVQDDVTISVASPPPPSSSPVTAAFQDGVGGYAGTRDTMIRALNAATNYGSLTALEADGSPDIASLLRWDLSSIPVGSTVLSATIELTITNTTNDSYPLLAMERAWSEFEATWNQASNGVSWSSGGAAATTDRAPASLGNLSPGSNGRYVLTLNAAGVAAVQRWVDNPAINFGVAIQNYATASNGMDFRSRETADVSQRPKFSVSYQPPAASEPEPPVVVEPVNQAPQVFAGADRTATVGSGLALNGIVTDDSAAVTTSWSRVSGPGQVAFSNPSGVSTVATFAAPGTYVLRLTASDGQLTAYDDLVVEVTSELPTNQPPTVSAGADQAIQQGAVAALAGTAADDGPATSLSTTWSKASGPGNVVFDNPAAVNSHATFSAPGVYVLRLTASDGAFVVSDEVTITVQAVPGADPALLGAWEMEAIVAGSVADASGSGHTASVVGAPAATQGISGGALAFSKNDYLLIDDSPELNVSTQITIAAWIKPSASGTQYVVRKGRHDSTNGFELSLSSAGKVFVRFNQASSGDAYRVDSTSKYPTTGSVWMHVAATYDGATIKLYVNGVLQASKNAVFAIAANNLPMSIGAQDDGYRGFAGSIDGVKLFNRALTAEEIAALKANV